MGPVLVLVWGKYPRPKKQSAIEINTRYTSKHLGASVFFYVDA